MDIVSSTALKNGYRPESKLKNMIPALQTSIALDSLIFIFNIN